MKRYQPSQSNKDSQAPKEDDVLSGIQLTILRLCPASLDKDGVAHHACALAL
jgi:hypothetical protein